MKQLVLKMQEQLNLMCSTGKLFRAAITGDDLYSLYLTSFAPGTDPVFRDPESSTHNCNNCKNFIRRYGNIVAIAPDGSLVTLFGGAGITGPYDVVATSMDARLKASKIESAFFESFDTLDRSLNYERCTKGQNIFQLGIAENHKQYTKEEADKYGIVSPGEVKTFTHMNVQMPRQFVVISGHTVESVVGQHRDKYQVFKRAMEEISIDTLNLVEDLINQGSLLDGAAHLHVIKTALTHKAKYNEITGDKDNWLWFITYDMDERTAKFRNTLIGVLCVELSQGEDLNKSCENWNKRVDPANYHKVTAPITNKQIEDARKFVEDNGYTDSFERRLATMDDINVAEIKHMATGDGKIKSVTAFDNVKATATQHKRAKFDDVEEVPIEKFMADILPKCTSVEAMLLNSHEGHLVTLTTSKDKDSKRIFKWGNNFSWTFNGNLAGRSQIKDAVAIRGGRIDGVLRFSIMWGEGDMADNSDLDAHAEEPNINGLGQHIFFSSGYRKDQGNRRTPMSGQLDVDITQPNQFSNKNIVENITWTDLSKMANGVYKLYVNQFADRGSKGFRAEVEFNGELHEYTYNSRVSGNVMVAEVTLKDGEFTIKHLLPSTYSNKELWGLQTNEFHRVNLVCVSPNYWADNAVGNKHYFFMLEQCKTDGSVRSFHNENLSPDLLKHRKVMEVLGATNAIKPGPNDKQLSGLGFNSTVRDEVILKLSGSFKRIIKVKF